jgi:hypothetical protein
VQRTAGHSEADDEKKSKHSAGSDSDPAHKTDKKQS